MIYRFLVDDSGDFYMMTVETEDKQRTVATLKGYSRDVRYVDSKDELGKKDTGKRRLPDGSIVRRCVFFGCKVGAMMRFEKSAYKLGTVKKAVML